MNEEFDSYFREGDPIFKNPTSKELRDKELNKDGYIRFSLNLKTGTMYVFPGEVLHQMAFSKIKGSGHSYKKFIYPPQDDFFISKMFFNGTAHVDGDKLKLINSDSLRALRLNPFNLDKEIIKNFEITLRSSQKILNKWFNNIDQKILTAILISAYKNKPLKEETMNNLNEEVIKLKSPEKNSKGEKCYYAIRSHKTGKILSRHKTKEQAYKRLKQVSMFSHFRNYRKESLLNDFKNELLNETAEYTNISIKNAPDWVKNVLGDYRSDIEVRTDTVAQVPMKAMDADVVKTYMFGGTKNNKGILVSAVLGPNDYSPEIEDILNKGDEVPLTPNLVLGKPMSILQTHTYTKRAVLFMHPDNVLKILEDKSVVFSKDEKVVLLIIRGINSSERKEEFLRYLEDLTDKGYLTRQEKAEGIKKYEEIIASLKTKGCLTAAGAINTKGRNVIAKYRTLYTGIGQIKQE